MSSSGLGGLAVNTVVLPFYEIAGLTTRMSQHELHVLGSSSSSYEGLERRLTGPADSADFSTEPLSYVGRHMPRGILHTKGGVCRLSLV